jgi:hypothetical protein
MIFYPRLLSAESLWICRGDNLGINVNVLFHFKGNWHTNLTLVANSATISSMRMFSSI